MASQTSAYIAIAILSVTLGYWVGVGASLPPISRGITPGKHEDSSDDEDELPEKELANVSAEILEECKLVLVVRKDLGMTTGKIAAQCSHATLACYKALQQTNPSLLRHWERKGQAKIALQVSSEGELDILEAQAKSLSLCARLIHDGGRTQIAAGSRTVLGIGPAPVKLINQVTGKLKLL